jgi:hypothetical protein
MQKFLAFLTGAILAVLIAVIIGVIVVEWASGCGETYTDSKGIVHENGCFLIVKSK